MLGKHDPFKVVLDPATDPGADKRGLFWSRPVLPQGEDTGGACSLPNPLDFSGKGADIDAAQLIQFICTCLLGQTLGSTQGVPVAKSLRSGDADCRCSDDAPGRPNVRQRANLLPPIH